MSYSQAPIPGPKSRFRILHTYLSSILILYSQSLLSAPNYFLHSGLPTKTLYAFLFCPIRAKYPAHLIIFDLITLTIFDEGYKSWCSLSILVQRPVTSSRSSWSVILKYLLGCQQFPNKWLCNDERDSKFDAAERRESNRLHEHVETRVRMSVNAHCFVVMLSRPIVSTPA